MQSQVKMPVNKFLGEDNATFSYGVYFTSHGRNQGHNRIIIKDGVCIGMRENIAVRHDFEIGENVITGVSTFVNKSVPLGNTCVNILGRLINKD